MLLRINSVGVCVLVTCVSVIIASSSKTQYLDSIEENIPFVEADDDINDAIMGAAKNELEDYSSDMFESNKQFKPHKYFHSPNADRTSNADDEHQVQNFLNRLAMMYIEQQHVPNYSQSTLNTNKLSVIRGSLNYGNQRLTNIEYTKIDVLCDSFNVSLSDKERLLVAYNVDCGLPSKKQCVYDGLSVNDNENEIKNYRINLSLDDPSSFLISGPKNLTIVPSGSERCIIYNVSLAKIKEIPSVLQCNISDDCSELGDEWNCRYGYCNNCSIGFRYTFGQCIQCPGVSHLCMGGCCYGAHTQCYNGRCVCADGYVYFGDKCGLSPTNSYELAAQIALISVLCLAVLIGVVVSWKACSLRRDRRLGRQTASLFSREARTASLTSLEREVQRRLENRPPVYSISADKPPRYEDILLQTQANAETQTSLDMQRQEETTFDSNTGSVSRFSTCYENAVFSGSELPITHHLRQPQTM